MPTHKTLTGQVLIDDLVLMGKALDYIVRTEEPTKQKKRSPAVDVAWLRSTNQKFPLMILEVESVASNSATYNPVKVFGPRNMEFEKPLFFFHIFISGGSGSSRIKDLQSLFGTYNYRAYRLNSGEMGQLLCDIVSQHRRVSTQINFLVLGKCLLTSPFFAPHIDLVVPHVLSLDFEEDIITHLAKLTLHDKRVEPFLRDEIMRLHKTPNSKRGYPNYPSYLGSTWSAPIHIGLLQFWSKDTSNTWLNQLRSWQEHRAYLSQIGPHFGMARDYDEFIYSMAPVLWGLVAGLMKSCPDAGIYILTQCFSIFDQLSKHPSRFSRFWAVWILHIAAAYGIDNFYEIAQRHLNVQIGGIPHRDLYRPKGYEPIEEVDQEPTNDKPLLVPPLSEFRQHMSKIIAGTPPLNIFGIDTALEALLDDMALQEWGAKVAQLLWTDK